MKYKCLILDHDDTAVRSTPDIHYPSFVEALKFLRPDISITLKEFVKYCFNPGFSGLCKDIFKFNEEEQKYQYDIWKSYTTNARPDFYRGFPQIVKKYKKNGGIICVVSHSESKTIIRDYNKHCDFTPDMIFGWELEEDQRKPHPYPVIEIMKNLGLNNTDILVVDDSGPGLTMAKSCNVDFAAAGWSHQVIELENYMRNNSDYYFATVDEFKEFIIN